MSAEVGAAEMVSAADASETKRLPRVRKLIAHRMTESLRLTAQLTAVQEADMSEVAALRARAKEAFRAQEGGSLTFLPFFARALAAAAVEFPDFNASISESGNEVVYHSAVHLGIAVDTPRGLMVPVIRNAEQQTVPELARSIADVAGRVRNNKIGPDELSGSTITLSNIGAAGTLTDTPIINYPEVAILGTGAVVRRPRVVTDADGGETIAIRSVASLPLTYDHRLVDGADAGRFLGSIRKMLEAADFEKELADLL
ncbi:2-oxo acid dehydrogenase subunit E2 [Rhodococcus fascians]|nr:2-oxo acid dehydrogenase subunit E2 [Rhodococcus fascians]MBY4140966.1 2-oxo acid dehydrogenase subunit E2 [Rhodococcus fascians]MBY4219630.1 2-oxo acid dehydrogenase subunit E2 [Rhodococcus fascians]MBY4221939.1 2-oxo acid dehydrogenase subunit E2 [Rhodococcus fascians]MBY4233940.1 2-oxo acid dehydrogenase subunit E2 [Rhodococcus fascians]